MPTTPLHQISCTQSRSPAFLLQPSMSSHIDEKQALYLAQSMYGARLISPIRLVTNFACPTSLARTAPLSEHRSTSGLRLFAGRWVRRCCLSNVIFDTICAGNSLTKLPSIAGVEICLYTLYYEVFRAGGIEKVEPGTACARAVKLLR
jgi:hypothetical protein